MSAAETLRGLRGAGLTLRVDSAGRLTVRGDRSGYTAALKEAVATHRNDLLGMVSAGSAGSAGCFQPHAGTREENKHSSLEKFSSVLVWNDPAEPADPAPHPADEIASLPVALTRSLPAPCTLLVLLGGRQAPSVFTSSAARAELERAAQRAVWSPGEYELAAYAVQEGRAYAGDLAAWDERKVRTRGSWSLTVQEALGGAVGLLEAWGLPIRRGVHTHGRIPAGVLMVTWGQLLARIGAELVSVESEPEALASATPSEAQADASAVDALL